MAQANLTRQDDNTDKDFRITLDSLDMGVLILDSDLKMEFINSACYKLWDVDPDKLMAGSRFREPFAAKPRTGVLRRW